MSYTASRKRLRSFGIEQIIKGQYLQLFYWKSPAGNFGDDLNLWLWDVLLPGWREWRPEAWLVGVGTILNTRLLPGHGLKVVIGSGAGFGHLPDVSDPTQYDIRCVRGPRTAAALGLPLGAGVTDPAALIPELPEFAAVRPKGRKSFMPHCHSDLDADYDWPKICSRVDMDYISPRGASKDVIKALGASSLVITESMHGAILADAFRVPWIPVCLTPKFNFFKWQDWGDSVGISLRITKLPVMVRKMRGVARRFGLIAGDPAGTTGGGHPRQTMLHRVQHDKTAKVLARLANSEPFLSADLQLSRKREQLNTILYNTLRTYSSG